MNIANIAIIIHVSVAVYSFDKCITMNRSASRAAEPRSCLVAPLPSKDLVLQRLFSAAGDDGRSSSSITSSDQALDQLAVLRRLEATTYKPQDYYATVLQLATKCDSEEDCHSPQGREEPLSRIVVSRQSTVEYLYRISDYGGFERHVVGYAMNNLLDRYFSSSCRSLGGEEEYECIDARRVLLSGDKNHYQLVALTCLYMAVKLLEPVNIGVASMVPLTNGLYSVEDFCEMERTILKQLQWRVAHGPTGTDFVRLLLQYLPGTVSSSLAAQIFHQSQYQLELAVSDYELCCCCSSDGHSGGLVSDLAVAALWNALEWTEVEEFSLADQLAFRTTIRRILSETSPHRNDSTTFLDHALGTDAAELTVDHLQERITLEEEATQQLQAKLTKLLMDAYASNQIMQDTKRRTTKSTNSSGTGTVCSITAAQTLQRGCVSSSTPHRHHGKGKYRSMPLDPESVRDVTRTHLLMYA